MLTLYSYPELFGVADNNGYGLKVFAFLRLCKIDFRQGTAQQSGYHDFRVVRMNLMPVIETYIVPSSAPPGGFGEHAVPHVAPAIVIFSRCYRAASVSDRCLVAIE